MKRKIQKYSKYGFMMLVLCAMFSVQASALEIDIAGPIRDAWNDYVVANLKEIMAVVFTAISAILLILLVIRLVTIGISYKNHQQQEIEWIPLIVIGVCLVLSATASTWMWSMVSLTVAAS